jgi:hypothetical protein
MNTRVLAGLPVMPTALRNGQMFAVRLIMAIAAGLFIWCGLAWSIGGS